MTNLTIASINSFIKHSSEAIAIVDIDMRIIGHSKVWLDNIAKKPDNVIGENYYTILPETTDDIKETLQKCLANGSCETKETKLIHSNGTIQWLKWKINTWYNASEKISGLVIVNLDVTKEKYRENLLLKAEKVARIGGWEIDMRNGQLHWTDVTKEIHEVPYDFNPNLEKSLNFYKKGFSRDEITKLINQAIATGKPWSTELQIITAKGKEVWVRIKGETDFFNEKCIRIYGTFQDIDQEKRTELEYQNASNKLSIALDTALIGLWDYNLITNEVVWNKHMYSIYKIEQNSDIFYKDWEKLVHPEDLKNYEKAIENAINNQEKLIFEFRIYWPDGSIRHIKSKTIITYDAENKPIKLTGGNVDITEFKTTKLKLKRNNESFNDFFDQSNIGMVILGRNGEFKEANKNFCNSIGYSHEELIGKKSTDFTLPDDKADSSKKFKELIAGKMSSCQVEKKFHHKNGKIVHVLITATSVYDIHGNISHFIGQIIDITPRIEVEKRLNTLVNVTKSQNESLMNFAHIVSHNLRSHASNMTMLIKFLKEENNQAEKENIEEMLKKAIESLNETVLHLNDVILIKTGSLEKMKSKSLINSITRVKNTISVLFKEKEATCHINVCKTHFVNVVPAYLDSIFLNLLTNSLKYSSPNRKPIIEISSKIEEDFIIVYFTDNGQGIDLKRHGDKIFGMYKTFHHNKDAKGIGLFITKNQIEAMNGSISLESEPDKGTTFILKLQKA